MTSTDAMDTEGRHKHRQTDSGRVICLAGLCVRPKMLHNMTPTERAALRFLTPRPRVITPSRATFDVDEAIRVLRAYCAALRQATDDYRRARTALAAYQRSTTVRPPAPTLLRTPAKRAPSPYEWDRLLESLPAMATRVKMARVATAR